LPRVSTTLAANFATSSACVVDTGGKFATGVNVTGGKICHQCQRRRWQIATSIYATGDKFAAGVVDTGGKIMGTISGCRHLKVNLQAKII
jgi:hypothetical protein